MKTKVLYSFLFLLSYAYLSYSQTMAPYSSSKWVYNSENAKVEMVDGKECLFLNSDLAYLDGVNFSNGIIEFDVKFEQQRSFVGAIFRMIDTDNFEDFYMRSHQSGNPDATQYTPVFNGNAGWQIYSGDGYTQAVKFDFGTWTHVKIVLKNHQAEIFVKDMNQPILAIPELKMGNKSGKIGVRTFLGPAYFTNFTYHQIDLPELTVDFKPPGDIDPSIISKWQISSTINEKSILETSSLPEDLLNELSWQVLESGNTGLVNISRITKLSQEGNTVFAKVVIHSESDQIKEMMFGFSDRVQVFLDGKKLFAGNDSYRSRDYRFLGTVGFFDSLHLPLTKGENELILAISENFGGWGFRVKLKDINGINIE